MFIEMCKEAGLAAAFYTCVRNVLGRVSAVSPNILNAVFVVFLNYSRQISGIMSHLGRDRFLPNPFQFIIHPSSDHPTLHILDITASFINQLKQIIRNFPQIL
jgi:hypothetical protein